MSNISRSAVIKIQKIRNQKSLGWVQDHVAIEEPLEIRLEFGTPEERQGMSIAITMRTPGHDKELALGFLFSEGVISGYDQVEKAFGCGPKHPLNGAQNILKVLLKPHVVVDQKRLSRHVFTTSSCGICGKTSLEAVRTVRVFEKAVSPEKWLSSDLLELLPELLRKQQSTFDATGGLHAAAIFDKFGEMIMSYEDVGRHNALDKVIGHLLVERQLPARERILLVSGRASFELVQKAAMAGIPVMAAIGAPSSLAVDLAHEMGMGLIGFLKPGRINIYAGEHQIKI